MNGLSPKIPLTRDVSDGFSLTKTYDEMIKQNFKNLVLTSPGERVMDPEFGVGIRQFLFEQKINSTYDDIEDRIFKQASIYLPFIEITDILFGSSTQALQGGQQQLEFIKEDENSLIIRIEYFIIPLGVSSALEVPVDIIS